MKKNAFKELEEKTLREHPALLEQTEENIKQNLSLAHQVSNIIDLYIPRFLCLFINMAGGNHCYNQSKPHQTNGTLKQKIPPKNQF